MMLPRRSISKRAWSCSRPKSTGAATVAFDETRVAIDRDGDVVTARMKGRELASRIGFSGTDLTIIATAISEIARNICVYAGRGEMVLNPVAQAGKRSIAVVARDC